MLLRRTDSICLVKNCNIVHAKLQCACMWELHYQIASLGEDS